MQQNPTRQTLFNKEMAESVKEVLEMNEKKGIDITEIIGEGEIEEVETNDDENGVDVTNGVVSNVTETEAVDTETKSISHHGQMLPPVKAGDETVTLLEKEGYRLEALMRANKSTCISEGVLVTPVCNGRPMVSPKNRVVFSKRQIESSRDYKIMKKIFDFNIRGITSDDLKLAYDRLIDFLQMGQVIDTGASFEPVDNIYRQIMKEAMRNAKKSILGAERKMVYEKGRGVVLAYKYESDALYLVHTTELGNQLFEAGYSKQEFCNALSDYSILKKIDPLIIRAGGNRWATTLQDGRYYKFAYNKEICGF